MPETDGFQPTEELSTQQSSSWNNQQQSSTEESSRDAKRRIKADKKQAQEDFRRAKVALKDARRRAGKTNTPKVIGFILLAILLIGAGGVGGWYVTTNFLQTDRTTLESKLDTANAEITDLENKLETANKEISDLKSKLATAEGEIRGLKNGSSASVDSSSEVDEESESASTDSSTEGAFTDSSQSTDSSSSAGSATN